jgi:hypothetical protein
LVLTQYVGCQNKYAENEEKEEIWLRDLILLSVLSIFTLGVQTYITVILWKLYGINEVYKPYYQEPFQYKR